MIFLDVGSNLEREKSIRGALAALSREFGIARRSSVWESPAYPPGSRQPNFFNLAVELERPPDPSELRAIEAALGRVRTEDKYAARTLDLDITLCDGRPPHPQVATQPFVLVPLCELIPDYVHPELGVPLRELLEALPHGPETIWKAAFQEVRI